MNQVTPLPWADRKSRYLPAHFSPQGVSFDSPARHHADCKESGPQKQATSLRAARPHLPAPRPLERCLQREVSGPRRPLPDRAWPGRAGAHGGRRSPAPHVGGKAARGEGATESGKRAKPPEWKEGRDHHHPATPNTVLRWSARCGYPRRAPAPLPPSPDGGCPGVTRLG